MSQRITLLKEGQNRDAPVDICPPDEWHQTSGCRARNGGMVPVRQNAWRLKSPVSVPLTFVYPQRLFPWVYPDGSELMCLGASLYGNTPKAYVAGNSTGTPTWYDVTPAGWGINGHVDDVWTGGAFNNVAILHSGYSNFPSYCSGLGVAGLTLPGWPVAGAGNFCHAMRGFRYHLIAMNMIENTVRYPNRVAWSSAAGGANTLPLYWTAAAGRDCGSVDLVDTPGPPIDGGRIGEAFMIYKRDAIYRMNYVGGQTVMSIQPVTRSAGVLAANCIATAGNLQLVLGPEDVFAINEGGEIKSLAEGKIRRYILSQLDDTTYFFSHVAFNSANNELWMFVPTRGSDYPDHAFILNLTSGKWSEISAFLPGDSVPSYFMASTAAPYPESSDRLMLTKLSANLQSNTVLVVDDLTAGSGDYKEFKVTPTLTTLNNDFGDPDRFKLLTGIRLIGEFAAGETFDIAISTHDLRDGTATLAQTVTFTAGSTNQVGCTVSGRFFDITLTGTATPSTTIAPWRLDGLELEYELQGQW